MVDGSSMIGFHLLISDSEHARKRSLAKAGTPEVEQVLEAANWAPSHLGREPWRYTVVEEGAQWALMSA